MGPWGLAVEGGRFESRPVSLRRARFVRRPVPPPLCPGGRRRTEPSPLLPRGTLEGVSRPPGLLRKGRREKKHLKHAASVLLQDPLSSQALWSLLRPPPRPLCESQGGPPVKPGLSSLKEPLICGSL